MYAICRITIRDLPYYLVHNEADGCDMGLFSVLLSQPFNGDNKAPDPIEYVRCCPVKERTFSNVVPDMMTDPLSVTLQWRHNGLDCVSNHQSHDCLLKCLFRRRSKKTSKLRATGLCAGNSPETGDFPAQRASNAENASIWWCHMISWWLLKKGIPFTLSETE